MRKDLVGWQWSSYQDFHANRRNLLIHVLTVPMFQAGSLVLLATPVLGWTGLAGLVAMLVTLAAQGKGHRGESNLPIPFTGPGDFVSRFVVEQWITFPRYVLSGSFARAWRSSA